MNNYTGNTKKHSTHIGGSKEIEKQPKEVQSTQQIQLVHTHGLRVSSSSVRVRRIHPTIVLVCASGTHRQTCDVFPSTVVAVAHRGGLQTCSITTTPRFCEAV